jgi:hypothetical protein
MSRVRKKTNNAAQGGSQGRKGQRDQEEDSSLDEEYSEESPDFDDDSLSSVEDMASDDEFDAMYALRRLCSQQCLSPIPLSPLRP